MHLLTGHSMILNGNRFRCYQLWWVVQAKSGSWQTAADRPLPFIGYPWWSKHEPGTAFSIDSSGLIKGNLKQDEQ
ncbi:MAG: hypothetical protein WBM41_06085 [Arenicellales bacterium]